MTDSNDDQGSCASTSASGWRVETLQLEQPTTSGKDGALMPPPPLPKIRLINRKPRIAPHKCRWTAKLLSKYPEVAELITALEHHKPSSLQEIWHGLQQELDGGKNGCIDWSSTFTRTPTDQCDFGSECEMPWLHPIWDVSLIADASEKQVDRPTAPAVSQIETEPEEEKECDKSNVELKPEDWRYGPAKYWYDILGVPENASEFDFGFKLKRKDDEAGSIAHPYPEDAYLMVTQAQWEDDVIWNKEDISVKDQEKFKSKGRAVGFRTPSKDTSQIYRYQNKNIAVSYFNGLPYIQKQRLYETRPHQDVAGDPNVPVINIYENKDLINGSWEEEIIWDVESMDVIPKPKIVTLDPNDENIVLGVPEDIYIPHNRHQVLDITKPTNFIKIPHPYLKNVKIVLGNNGITTCTEESGIREINHLQDPFNVSNDNYYSFRSSDMSLRLKPIGGKLIQHSTPILELRQPFIPTYMGPIRLRNFHRPPLKRYSHGPLAYFGSHPVYSLTKDIKKKAQEKAQERLASGGGDVFFMHSAEDLTGKDGELVLVEFCEEHPPLMNEVGMCSKVVNYYKRKAAKDDGPPTLRYGEIVYSHTSPFLGALAPGQCLQVVENNMYRAPVFEHSIPETDFVVIRNRYGYSIREADAVFVAGQQCPLYEVPAPHSRCATNFVRDFLQVYIYRSFLNCGDSPPHVRMDEIKKAFPASSDLVIRKHLKLCADFKRIGGMDSHCWVLKPDFRLPTEEELREMISPEQCCAHFSMLAAEQRLKDAGYGGTFIFVPSDDEEEDEELRQLKMDDEVKTAPWNTTRAFINALTGKRLLELSGPADPTGCGEGFSYISIPNKKGRKPNPGEKKVETPKPSLTNAKNLLRSMGIPDKELKKLSNWEVMDAARRLYKKRKGKGKMGGRTMGKLLKENRVSHEDHFSRYKDESQRIFDLQNNLLASNEVLSTDDEESSEEDDSDVEELGKILENILSDGKSYSELSQEQEEKERQELIKMMMENSAKQSQTKTKHKKKEEKTDEQDHILKIYRTFQDSEGKEYTRVEVVRRKPVIDIYLKIRSTKDESFIRKFATPDNIQKEKMLKEKRRIQGQLSRLKRIELERDHAVKLGTSAKLTSKISTTSIENNRICAPEKITPHPKSRDQSADSFGSNVDGFATPSSLASSTMKKGSKVKLDPKRRCGACGEVGHNKGNRICSLFSAPVTVALTEEEEEEFDRRLNIDDPNLVNVDGTKLKLSVKLIKHAEEMKRRSLVLKVPKDVLGRKRKRPLIDTHCDYLERHQRPGTANRRRTDPVVVLSNILETILSDMRDLPTSDPFHFPVNAKVVPNYHLVIQRPMDLQTMRENLRQKKYQNREQFLADVNQIVENSLIFNGPESPFTIAARQMMNVCVEKMGQKEEELMRLEETICPFPQTPRRSPSAFQPTSKVDDDLTVSESEDEAENIMETDKPDSVVFPVVP